MAHTAAAEGLPTAANIAASELRRHSHAFVDEPRVTEIFSLLERWSNYSWSIRTGRAADSAGRPIRPRPRIRARAASWPRPTSRPRSGILVPHPDWYHGHWNDHWDHPWNHWPAAWWGAGFLTGLGFDAAAPWAWGYWPDYNPYCGEPVVAEGAWIDYSQPIAMAAADSGDSESQAAAIRRRSCSTPPTTPSCKPITPVRWPQCDKALAPAAQRSAAARISRASACSRCTATTRRPAGLCRVVGGPWLGLDDAEQPVSRHRRLHRATPRPGRIHGRANRNPPEVRFVLAYHYLVCGHTDAAASEFKATPCDRTRTNACRPNCSTAPPTTAAAPGGSADAATGAAGEAGRGRHLGRRLEGHPPGRGNRLVKPYEGRQVHLGVRPGGQSRGSSAAPTRWPTTS